MRLDSWARTRESSEPPDTMATDGADLNRGRDPARGPSCLFELPVRRLATEPAFTPPLPLARLLSRPGGPRRSPNGAEVAEPVDAKVSKTFALAGVRVRVPPSALHRFDLQFFRVYTTHSPNWLIHRKGNRMQARRLRASATGVRTAPMRTAQPPGKVAKVVARSRRHSLGRSTEHPSSLRRRNPSARQPTVPSTSASEKMNSRTLIRMLEQDGFVLRNTKGSHKQYVHPYKSARVTVPHPCRTIPTGTLHNIYRQAHWDWKERRTR